MPDEMDRVQEACDRLLEDTLAERFRRHRLAAKPLPRLPLSGEGPGFPPDKGGLRGVDCLDCDNPIPAARLAVQPNAERCVQCQTDFETRRHA